MVKNGKCTCSLMNHPAGVLQLRADYITRKRVHKQLEGRCTAQIVFGKCESDCKATRRHLVELGVDQRLVQVDDQRAFGIAEKSSEKRHKNAM
jgi:hypothetical protein